VTVLIFLAMRVIPGDPLEMIQAEGSARRVLSAEELQQARASLGLDKPYYVQYLGWIGSIARGDLGESFWRGDKVRDIIARRAPITAEIAVLAIGISWLLGLPIGVLGAVRPGSWLDVSTRLGVILFLAIPSFWLGLLLISTSVLWFNWRPSLTIVYFTDDPIKNMQMVVGPVVVMGIGLAAVIARVARSATLEVLHEDYVRTARAKGLPDKVVLALHVFRNALLPIITVSGLALGGLLGGSVAVERAFGVPGLGQALVMALAERDWMVIQNLVLLYGLIFTFLNLLVDVSYGWIDPRIRYA
jgi:peptide/nickel transport system permease protein